MFFEKSLINMCRIKFILVLGLFCYGCASSHIKTNWEATLTDIELLAFKAARCLDSKSQKSIFCNDFAFSYKNGGFESMEDFTDNLSKIYKEDFDAGAKATEQILKIIEAFAFLTQT